LAAVVLMSGSKVAEAATVQIVNDDAPGVGFNDPTPPTLAAPGNSGVTVGEQKLEVVQWAADQLGLLLYSSVPITIEVSHDDTLFCDANAATLASSGPAWLVRMNNQPIADHPDLPTWYPSALAHRLTGNQTSGTDVTTVFNPDLGAAACLDGFEWYYGLDNDAPPGTLPFVDTVLHEITHGLGFTSLSGDDGLISPLDPTSISPYFAYAYDSATAKFWWELTPAERTTSSTSGLLVWAGPATRQAAAGLAAPLDANGNIYMYAPGAFDEGSSLSHFDEGTSPDLLMEPFASSQLDIFTNDIDLGLEFLQDIGWRDQGCGNGIVDSSEECDLGAGNDQGADEAGECTELCEWFVVDDCPSDPAKTSPGICDCGTPDTDSDADGTVDCIDACDGDPNKTAAGICGCGVSDADADSDGAADCIDGCDGDPDKQSPGTCGCGTADTDTDSDGAPDCVDECTTDATKTAAGVCGCGVMDTDSDSDGTADCIDECVSDPSKVAAGICGCGVADTDSDADGTADCVDGCPTDPGKLMPLVCGCGVPETDSDLDGVLDCNDLCPADRNKIDPGLCGCGASDVDSDADATPDCDDTCPQSAIKIAPGVCGCNVPDTDSDGDGTPDCHDLCPSDPGKSASGACGCGVADTDSDADGTPDCQDLCPNDSAKTSPGTCGCEQPEVDSDSDGWLDCVDECPDDPTKSERLTCGCGIPESDQDGDRATDCIDECPMDPNKVEPGVCGCGVGDMDLDGDNVKDCLDDCPGVRGVESLQGCLPEIEVEEPVADPGDGGAPPVVIGDGGTLQAIVTDGGYDDELERLLGKEGMALLNDGGPLDRATLEALLAEGGLDSQDIQRMLLQQALSEWAQDGGATVDLGLELPDSCQCRVETGAARGDHRPALGLMLLGLVSAVLRRRRRDCVEPGARHAPGSPSDSL
jgi:MYXO-CTERM domain-containing protein